MPIWRVAGRKIAECRGKTDQIIRRFIALMFGAAKSVDLQGGTSRIGHFTNCRNLRVKDGGRSHFRSLKNVADTRTLSHRVPRHQRLVRSSGP
jgi:hypothetical protein